MKENALSASLLIGLATLGLVALAFASAGAGADTTYATFSDGTSSKSLTFAACGDSVGGLYFAFPDGSIVVNVSVDLTYTVNASTEAGTFSIDIANDGIVDARRDIRVDLFEQPRTVSDTGDGIGLKAALNARLTYARFLNGTNNIPVVFSACPTTGPLTVHIDNVHIVTTDTKPANSPPQGIAGGISMDVVEGDVNVSAVNLREVFVDPDGDMLGYCMTPDGSTAGLSLAVSVLNDQVLAVSTGGSGRALYNISATDDGTGDCTGPLQRRLVVNVLESENRTLSLLTDIPDVYIHAGSGESGGFRLADYFELPSGGGLSFAFLSDSLSSPPWDQLMIRFESNIYNQTGVALDALRVWAPNGAAGNVAFRVRVSDTAGRSVTSNEATLHVSSWDAPALVKPIPSFTVVRGERIVSALDLHDYFTATPYGEFRWNWNPTNYGAPWTSRLDITGGWLDITAGAANWTGVLYGTIEACEGSTRCAASNNFTVRFVDPIPASLGAPISIVVDQSNGGAIPANTSFNLSLATAIALPSETVVTWYIDAQEKGQGPTLQNLSLPDGFYRAEARLVADDGERWVQVTLVVGSAAVPGKPIRPANLAPAGPWVTWQEALPWVLIPIGFVLAFLGFSEVGRVVVFGPVLGAIFARLNREALLDHFARGRLYQLVVDEPGIHFSELRDRTRVSNGAAVHHLRVLEKGGYIRVIVGGSHTRYFPTDKPLDRDTFGLSDTDRAVLEAVADRPGISQPDLQGHVGRSSSVVSRSVNRLSTLGYVTATTEGRKRRVFPRANPQPGLPGDDAR